MSTQKLCAGLIGGMLMLGLTLSNQALAFQGVPESEVPEAAVKTFQKTYPKATGAEWKKKKVHLGKMKGQTVYEVEFEDEHGIDHEMSLTPEGKLIKGKLD